MKITNLRKMLFGRVAKWWYSADKLTPAETELQLKLKWLTQSEPAVGDLRDPEVIAQLEKATGGITPDNISRSIHKIIQDIEVYSDGELASQDWHAAYSLAFKLIFAIQNVSAKTFKPSV